MQVGQLFVGLGIKPDASWKQGLFMMRDMRRMAWGMAAVFGAKGIGGALVGFNMKIEDSKNQIAGMLALAKKSSFSDELKNAGFLYDELKKKAAELPGVTQDYVNMFAMLTEPMARAKMTNEEMLDMTVQAKVAATGLGEGWQKAGRDISEFINFGKMNKVDTFIRRLFPEFDNDKGKAQLKAMGNAARARMMLTKLKQPALVELGEAQRNSLSGRLDKLKDTIKTTLGKIGEGLSKALGPALVRLNKWLTENQQAVTDMAEAIGDKLVVAFNLLVDVFSWLADHGDIVKTLFYTMGFALAFFAGKALLAWAAVAWPILAGAAVFGSLFYLFTKLKEYIGGVGAAFITLFIATKILSVARAVGLLTSNMWGLSRASAAATTSQAGGGLLGMFGGRRAAAAGGAASLAGSYLNSGGDMGLSKGANSQHPSANGFVGIGGAAGGAAATGGKRGILGRLGAFARVGGRAIPWVGAALTAYSILEMTGVADKIKDAGSWAAKKLKGIFGSGEQVDMGGVWDKIMAKNGIDVASNPTGRMSVSNSPIYNINVTGVENKEQLMTQLSGMIKNSSEEQLRMTINALAGNK